MSRLSTNASRWPTLLLLVLAIGLGVQISRLVLALVTPQSPAGRPSSVSFRIPIALNGEFDPFFRTQTGPGPSVVTALPIKLFGTRLDSATGKGFAIIAAPDGQQSSFAVGEAIMPGVKLWAVARDEVTIDRNGARERLFLDQSIPTAQIGTQVTGQPTIPANVLQPTSDPNAQRIIAPSSAVPNSTAGAGGDVIAPSLDQQVPAMPKSTGDRGNEP